MEKTYPSSFKFAGIQLLVGEDKAKNLENARLKIDEAAKNGAQMISLPEVFNAPYSTDSFGPYSEVIGEGPSSEMLSKAAKENKVWLVGGSIPEKDPKDSKVYNTCLIYDPNGTLVAKHRKIHLFDVDIPGKITFQESKTLSPGNSLTIVDTDLCKIAVAICYDMRFPEIAMLAAKQGCKFLVYPGAFNTVTGPLHWELLQRARALDNQLYVSAVSPARNPESKYQAWGHSSVVNPWGEVISTCEHDPTIIYATIAQEKVAEIRDAIPVWKQKRWDLYDISLKQ